MTTQTDTENGKPEVALDAPDLKTLANGGIVRDPRVYVTTVDGAENNVVDEDAPPFAIVAYEEVDTLNEGGVLEKETAHISLVSGLQGHFRSDWTLRPPEE